MFDKIKRLFSGGASGEGAAEAAPPPPATTSVESRWVDLPELDLRLDDYRFRRVIEESGHLFPSGAALLAQGSGIAADRLATYRIDIAIAERIAGPDSIAMVDLLTNGCFAAGVERADRLALEYGERALAIARKHGDDSKASNALMRLAEFEYHCGSYDRAVTLIEDAVTLRTAALGSSHNHTIGLVEFREQIRSQPPHRPDLGPAQDEWANLLDMARATIPTRRMAMAENYALQAFNLAMDAFGGFSAETGETLSLLGEILLDAYRPNAALSKLLHAIDIVYVREGADAALASPLRGMIEQAIAAAPQGDYNPDGGPGIMTYSRNDGGLLVWACPTLLGWPAPGRGWPADRPLWGTISIAAVGQQIRESGFFAVDQSPRSLRVGFAIGPDGMARDVAIERSSGRPQVDAEMIRRLGLMRFDGVGSKGERHARDVWLYPHRIELREPESDLIARSTIVLQERAGDEPEDIWVMPCELATWVTPPALVSGTITSDDYPARAVRDELEGTTRLAFIVSAEGQIEAVEVIESSGHPILDEASIKALQRRLRYRPAIGEDGEPVRARMEQKITWRL